MRDWYYFDAGAHFWADWFNDCTNEHRPCRTIKHMQLKGGDTLNLTGNFVEDNAFSFGPRPISGEGLAVFLLLAAVIVVASIVKNELKRQGKWDAS